MTFVTVRAMKYFLMLLLLVACSVKDKADTQSPSVVQGPETHQTLPSNVHWTSGKTFLVRVDKDAATFTVGTMTATYYLVDPSLLPVADAELSVFYNMPEMPDMPVVPAVIEKTGPGLFTVTYDISMGGLWAVSLSFSRGGITEKLDLPEFTVPE